MRRLWAARLQKSAGEHGNQAYFGRWEVVLLALSIFFVGWQVMQQGIALRAQERALVAQIVQAQSQEMTELSKVFLNHPELRPYFDEKKDLGEAVGEDLRLRLLTLAEMHLDFIEGFADEHVRALPGMHEGGEYAVAWGRYFTDLFSRSPVLCKRYAETKNWYTERAFRKYIDEGCTAKSGAATHAVTSRLGAQGK